jgi:hypothetical protein
MEVITAISGVLCVAWLILGVGTLLLGQRLGTWEKLRKSPAKWVRNFSDFAFNYIMPVGTMVTIGLLPLIILMGLISFVVVFI